MKYFYTTKYIALGQTPIKVCTNCLKKMENLCEHIHCKKLGKERDVQANA